MENDVEAQFASVEEATGLIRLAQTHDLPQSLSPAFYYLATKSNPGTVFSIKTLSPTDQARIYAGRVKMTSAIIGIVARRPENGMRKGPCTSGSQPCYGCMELMWPGLPEGELLWQDLITDPLQELKWRYNNWSSCEIRPGYRCSERIKQGFAAKRKEMYRRMGEFFSL